MINQENSNSYQLNNIKGMNIEQGGSQRWLVIESKTVDSILPIMSDFLTQNGLTIKYQNKNIGIIQTDWATRNNTVAQTDVRAFFQWIGWGEMYSMPTQYMFRITMWQNGNKVQIYVTDIQMSEVYPGCGKVLNSSLETSDKQITRWMPMPPNPQLELEFLMQFMAFAGLSPEQITTIKKNVAFESATAFTNATKIHGMVLINDLFDRAWWRTGLALERVGLGVTDKNRTKGEYEVYSMQSHIKTPADGFWNKLFDSATGTNLQLPEAQYIVKLTPNGQLTNLTITPIKNPVSKDKEQSVSKYLNDLAKELY
ncbi:MAG: outer membrane protein assembly factor BamC, partial [Burkholderiales bacterium]|nr:outer membrane protein assembly factor BamC [Burkholderiales bacterium]